MYNFRGKVIAQSANGLRFRVCFSLTLELLDFWDGDLFTW